MKDAEKKLSEYHKTLMDIGFSVNRMLTKRKVSTPVLLYQAERLQKLAKRIERDVHE